MKSNITTLLFILIFPSLIFPQSQDLSILMEQLVAQVTSVESKKYTYDQTLTFDNEFPYRASLEASRVDAKGKIKALTSQFNLKDFDKNTVRKDNVKDVIVVKFSVDKKQKFVATLKDGERAEFVNEIEIIVSDVENAREIVDLLKKIISKAKEIPPAEPLPASFESRMTWLEKNITEAEKNGKPIVQKIKNEPLYKTRLVFEVESEGKNESTKETYKFNLIDIKGRNMRLDIKGKNVFIKLNAYNKFIRYEKDGELNNYQSKLTIYVPNIELGKNIVEVLQALVEESSKMTSSIVAKSESVVGTAFDGKINFIQKMEGECLVNFESAFDGKKGTTTDKNVFHFDDINQKSIEIKVSKKTIWVNAKTEQSKKLINVFENDELQNYSNKLSIRARSIENARQLKEELEKRIETCNGKTKCVDNSAQTTDDLMTFVQKNIKDIEEGSKVLGQRLEPTGDHENQWRFIQTETKKKGSEEKSYVFNLSDIDPNKIGFEISKKQITLVLHTNKKEEIIKTYKNSEPDNYVKNLKIQFTDITTVRSLICALQQTIEKL